MNTKTIKKQKILQLRTEKIVYWVLCAFNYNRNVYYVVSKLNPNTNNIHIIIKIMRIQIRIYSRF